MSDDCGVATNPDPDQRFVAVGCRDHATRVWDTARDRMLAELPPVTQLEGDFTSAFPVVSADGDRAAIARGNTVELYELPSARLLRVIKHGAPVSTTAFAPSRHDLVSGAIDGSLLVTRDDREPIALPGSHSGIDVATILADGRVVVAAAKQLQVYDPSGVAILANVEMPVRAESLSASPDGSRLVTVSLHTTNAASPPMLWDLERCQLVSRLEGHTGRVFAARFMAGGKVITAGGDRTVRLWDSATGRALQS